MNGVEVHLLRYLVSQPCMVDSIILSYVCVSAVNFLNIVTNFHQTWSEHSAFKGQVTYVYAESEGGNDATTSCCTVLRVCASFVFLET